MFFNYVKFVYIFIQSQILFQRTKKKYELKKSKRIFMNVSNFVYPLLNASEFLFDRNNPNQLLFAILLNLIAIF